MKTERSAAYRGRWSTWLALLVVALAAACGGGGGGVDTGGTGAAVGSYANGRISGFGSIIVNDVHFDESRAEIVDETGQRRAPGDLRLGMTVEVSGGPIVVDPATGAKRSEAFRIVLGSAIEGPVESIDAASSTARVLGQTVKLNQDTVLEGIASIDALQAGDVVEVYAFFDASSGSYTATRIERDPAAEDFFKLQGPITSVDPVTRTFVIGEATIAYDAVPEADLPRIAVGEIARVELSPMQQEGQWDVLRGSSPEVEIPETVEVTEIEGFVTEFESLSRFRVDGAIVDASSPGVAFEKGNASQLGDGAHIEVAGRMQDGVLMAERVEVLRGRSSDDGPEERQEFKLSGLIESADVGASRFVVRGITVTFDASTRFDKGGPSDLLAGAEVEVRGMLAGGNQLNAERIRIGK